MAAAGSDPVLPAREPEKVVVLATAEHARGATLPVAGLTVLERALRQLARMGYSVIVAATGDVPTDKILPGQAVVRRLDDAHTLEQLLQELGGATVVPADVVRPSNKNLEGGIRVVDEATRLSAEDAIFAELLRGDLGFVARHLNKPISFRITRQILCHLPVTPNEVTLGAALVGLLGCVLIATGYYVLVVMGFALVHLQSVLDGCDGELARVRFQQSAMGEWLDTMVDDAMNLAVIFSFGLGLWRQSGNGGDLAIALLACGMLLFYNVVAYRELIRQKQGGEVLKIRWWFTQGRDLKNIVAEGDGGAAIRFLLAAGRRDFFIFAWLVLALFDLGTVILAYASLVALGSFISAAGQLIAGGKNRDR